MANSGTKRQTWSTKNYTEKYRLNNTYPINKSEDEIKKSLNIPTVYSEAVNQRRTDNAMAKRKRDQSTNNDPQNITQKTKDQRLKLKCSERLRSSYSTTVNRRVTCIKYPVTRHINFV